MSGTLLKSTTEPGVLARYDSKYSPETGWYCADFQQATGNHIILSNQFFNQSAIWPHSKGEIPSYSIFN